MLKFFLSAGTLALLSFPASSQIYQPEKTQKHVAAVGVGLDNSLLAVNLRYSRYLHRFRSAPFLELTQNTALLGLKNTRTQVGIKTWLGNKRFFIPLQVGIQGIRATNKAGDYHSAGAVVDVSPGVMFGRFGAGIHLAYNPVFATHINHSAKFRHDIYQTVKDGWYKNTATNLRAGAYLLYLTGQRKSIEINLKAGYQTSGSMDQLLPPYYLLIGLNKRF